MENVQRDSWVLTLQASLSEFVSRPSEASQASLARLLSEYREAVESGEISLYRPRAA